MVKKRMVYMCGINWETDLNNIDLQSARNDIQLFESIDQLKEKKPCWKDHGIVRVEMTLKAVEEKDKYGWLKTIDPEDIKKDLGEKWFGSRGLKEMWLYNCNEFNKSLKVVSIDENTFPNPTKDNRILTAIVLSSSLKDTHYKWVEVTPIEWERIQKGDLSLPKGWTEPKKRLK